MNRARVVVVGCGRMGRIRSAIANAHPRLELVGIVDPHVGKARELASSFGVRQPSYSFAAAETTAAYQRLQSFQVQYFDDLRYSFSHAKKAGKPVDGVIVCSPTSAHSVAIRESALHGAHIFTEKPVGENAEKIKEAFEVANTYRVQLCCGFQRRFDESYKAASVEVRSKKSIGKPLMASIFFGDHPMPTKEFLLSGGDIFMDLAAHDVDYIMHCLDDTVQSVYATGTSSDEELAKAGVHDSATLIMNFRKGAVVSLFLSRSAAYGYDQRAEIFGTEGRISVENVHENSTVLSNRLGVHRPRLQHSFPQRFENAFSNEMNAFADTLLEKSKWPITADQCIAVQKVTDAAAQSCQIGQVVDLE